MFKIIRKELAQVFTAFFIALGVGILGYLIIEEMSFIEAFYMTIITVSTVGFGEVQELSSAGKLFTIFLIVTNIGIFTYAISMASSLLLGGKFIRDFQKITMLKKIKSFKNHVIVCGFGNTGKESCKVLVEEGIKFVVIEKEREALEVVKSKNYPFIIGDAILDDTLKDAQIESAKTIISTLPSDADNLFVVVTARSINPDIQIISKASIAGSQMKLHHAGANHVIMPDKIGGAHMARLVYSPNAYEFLDTIGGQAMMPVHLEEIKCEELLLEFQGKSINDLNCRTRTGANVIGLLSKENEYSINPELDEKISQGMKLIILATETQHQRFKKLFINER